MSLSDKITFRKTNSTDLYTAYNNPKKLLFFTLIFLALIFRVKADNSSIDSIKNVLEQQIDTITVICNQQPDSALIRAEFALNVAQNAKLESEQAELFRLIGLIWFYKVDYSKSLDYFTKSHDLFVELGDKAGEASSLNNISIVYRTQGFLNKAIEMDSTVLEMRKEINDPDKLAGGYNNMAVAYMDIQEYEKALIDYKEAIAISLKSHHHESLDLYYNNLGNLYFEINSPDSAYYYFQKSLSHSIPMDHKQMMANSYIYLGRYYLKKGEYEHAKENIQQGLKLSKEIGIVYEIEDAAKYLHEAYAKLGDYRQAYAAHLLFKEMADSAKNLETIQKITQTESELKYQKQRELDQIKQANNELADQLEINKQKQVRNVAILFGVILFLIVIFVYRGYKFKSKDNLELIKQKEEITNQKEEILKQRNHIEELNTTKDKFFAIIGHDLRNPISGIYKLSEVVYTNLEFLSKEKLSKYLLNIKTTSESVYSLLDNLLKWASIQSGNLKVNAHEFNLSEVVRQNKELLTGLSAQKDLKLVFENTDECLAFADVEMINTVVRNLMTNAIKFTPENGIIKVSLELKEDFWQVCVADTGDGISKHDQQLLFQLTPNSNKIGNGRNKGVGLGLVLCKDFTIRNGGDIWVNSEEGKGSTFCITVPRSKLAYS